MKVVVCDGAGDESVLRVADVRPPTLGPGEIRIRVAAAGVNRADLLQRRGLYPPPPGASPVLGLECAGRVLEVGDGVTGYSSGDRVMALLAGGGYAEEVVAPAACVIPTPEVYGALWNMTKVKAFSRCASASACSSHSRCGGTFHGGAISS